MGHNPTQAFDIAQDEVTFSPSRGWSVLAKQGCMSATENFVTAVRVSFCEVELNARCCSSVGEWGQCPPTRHVLSLSSTSASSKQRPEAVSGAKPMVGLYPTATDHQLVYANKRIHKGSLIL